MQPTREFVEFEVDDKENPRRWNTWFKGFIVVWICFNAFTITCYASTYLDAVPYVQELFHVGSTVAKLGFTFYAGACGIGPLFLAPLSELYGRKWVYVGSALGWTAFQVGAARAENTATILICRFFAALLGTASFSNAAGTIHDLSTPGLFQSSSTMLFCMALFMGPVIGPIVSGYIVENTTWRWIFYAAIIAGGVETAVFAMLPETHHGIILMRKAARLRKEQPEYDHRSSFELERPSVVEALRITATRAGSMLISDPIILAISLWQTTVFGIIYLFFDAIEESESRKAGGVRTPERRLKLGLLGAIIVPISLLWFGFTTYTSVPYMVPIVASGFYGFGFLAVSLSTFYYTIDAYTTYAASAFAAQAMIRSVATSVFVLFGTQMFSGLGPRWATFILAMIGVVEIALPIVFMRKGEALRKASGFASLEAEHDHVDASSDEEKQSVDDEKQVWVEGQTA
ncbi:hypothetical protein POSPLADRAFT_1184502 [Postia placenta MAD-698-R-SB12]|uniref:Major facilitator superfamily (MFS) profile domain-containing protein n=1 Tax=Postia placenta MAD-698-R-SB12 TaxID=670580 RepID=A0A1X6MQZ0_9APHY|nr:hypothetical protein POSPLADRAFT_1184502 [Postia placenta MAD-698-R-SB12]OSX58814.1 hypothetical protein POSPLADRAFT_1184502 [Postia placenta MAD-698-R-SB12]